MALRGVWVAVVGLLLAACAQPQPQPELDEAAVASLEERGFIVDERSYNLGMLAGFAELVREDVKGAAFGNSLPTPEMDVFYPDVAILAERKGISVYRDATPLNTDLFSFDEGNEIVMLYKGDTLDRYLAIKADQARLIEAGEYEGEARLDIARRFGRLLSYSDEAIERMLVGHDD